MQMVLIPFYSFYLVIFIAAFLIVTKTTLEKCLLQLTLQKRVSQYPEFHTTSTPVDLRKNCTKLKYVRDSRRMRWVHFSTKLGTTGWTSRSYWIGPLLPTLFIHCVFTAVFKFREQELLRVPSDAIALGLRAMGIRPLKNFFFQSLRAKLTSLQRKFFFST